MSTSDRALKNNPLIPYWGAKPGRGFPNPDQGYHILKYPNTLEAAKQIAEPQTHLNLTPLFGGRHYNW